MPYGTRLECTSTQIQGVTAPYTCNNGGDFNPNCPPPNAGGNGGSSSGDNGGSTTDGVPDAGSGGSSGSGGGSGASSGGSSGSSSGATSGGSGGNGGGTTDGVPDAGSSGSSGSSSGSGGSGASSGGGSSGNGHGGGPPWNCEPGQVEVTCTQPPVCSPGAHPAPCGACVPNGTSTDCTPPAEGGCWITGGGFVTDDDGKDTFGGNAMPMKDGSVRGEWENIEHGTGDNLHGQANYIYCRRVAGPGPGHPNGPRHNFDDNQAYFGGPATYNGASGYWFDVVVEDQGEPGRLDTYQITIRKGASGSNPGTVVFQESGTMAQGGNIQLHPPNGGHPATQSTLPSWVQLQP